MEFLNNLDEETLDRIAKCACQFSTALRTFSKVVVSLKKSGTKSPEISESETSVVTNNHEQLVDWLFSSCKWGPNYAQNVAEQISTGYRADRMKNLWRLTGEDECDRRDWTKQPFTQVKKLHDLYKTELPELSESILEQKKEQTPLWTKLHVHKRKRLYRTQNVVPITFTEFRKMLVTRHDELPSLRC